MLIGNTNTRARLKDKENDERGPSKNVFTDERLAGARQGGSDCFPQPPQRSEPPSLVFRRRLIVGTRSQGALASGAHFGKKAALPRRFPQC